MALVTACAAGAAATARFWLDPDSDLATVHVLRYAVFTYQFEILLILAAIIVLVAPSRWRSRVATMSGRMHRSLRQDVLNLRRPTTRWRSAARLLPVALTVAISVVALVRAGPSLVDLARARSSLLLKYSDMDLLRFLCREAQAHVDRLDFAGAESYYRTIVKLFGENERTAEVRRELEAIPKHRAYGLRWIERAAELERSSGANRQSLYLYVDALPFVPQSESTTSRVRTYLPLLQATQQFDESLQKFCANPSEALAVAPEFARGQVEPLLGFASSDQARNLLSELTTMPSGKDRFKVLSQACNYGARFGPVLYVLRDEREAISNLLSRLKEQRMRGWRDLPRPYTEYDDEE